MHGLGCSGLERVTGGLVICIIVDGWIGIGEWKGGMDR